MLFTFWEPQVTSFKCSSCWMRGDGWHKCSLQLALHKRTGENDVIRGLLLNLQRFCTDGFHKLWLCQICSGLFLWPMRWICPQSCWLLSQSCNWHCEFIYWGLCVLSTTSFDQHAPFSGKLGLPYLLRMAMTASHMGESAHLCSTYWLANPLSSERVSDMVKLEVAINALSELPSAVVGPRLIIHTWKMPKLHLESCSKWLSNITPSQPLCLFILVSVWWFHQSPSTKESVTFDQVETN